LLFWIRGAGVMLNVIIGVFLGLFGFVLGVLWKTYMYYLESKEDYYRYRGRMFWYQQGKKK